MAVQTENFVAKVCDVYDHRLLEKRLVIEGNVCGCLLKDMELYDDCGLVPGDFITNHGRIMFSIVKQLREKGAQKFDEITFISSLEESFVKMVDETYGGYSQIYNLMEAISLKNWDSFLDELNKSNILLKLYKKGFNLFDQITLDNGKLVVPFDFFKNLTSNEVLEFYEGTIASMSTKVHNLQLIEEGYIEFDDAWVQRLLDKEEMGVSYGEAGFDIDGELIRTFPFMSANTLGFKPGTLSGFAAHSGTGKTTYMVTTAMSLASKGEKVVMITNESSLDDLKAIFLTWVIYRVLKHEKLTKRKIISGNINAEDMEIIKKAQAYWKENYAKKIKINTLADSNTPFSCQLIKKAVLREGASAFIVDTMKMTLDESGNDQTWLQLIKDVRKLTEIAMRYNIIGLITLQLAPNTLNRSWLDQSCLANCKQIKETLSNLVMFRKLYGPELDPQSPFFIHPFRRKMKEDGSEEWYDEPYDADPSKTWIIAFSDKTRRGIDSGMDGSAFLCRTDLDHSSFYETARCYPSHKLFNIEDRTR